MKYERPKSDSAMIISKTIWLGLMVVFS